MRSVAMRGRPLAASGTTRSPLPSAARCRRAPPSASSPRAPLRRRSPPTVTVQRRGQCARAGEEWVWMSHDAAPGELGIRVERTGGIAGLRREWSVHVHGESEVERWTPVVEACPWEEEAPEPVQPDRFVYEIRVTLPNRERSAVL